MAEQPYVDPGHRLSDEDWALVTARAKEIREEIKANAQGGAASGIVPINDMTGAGVASRKYFAESGIPTQLLVLHSGECPLAGGYARSLTLWAASVYPLDPTASWTWFIDPLEMVAFIPPNLGAWHASEANNLSEGFEQAGYARYTREQWLTPDGRTQLESLAYYMAQRALANGIPARWLNNAEVTAATNGDRSIKGLCFHRQIDPETRTDPGNGYPADLLLERIKFYMTGGTATTEEDDMANLTEDNLKAIALAVWAFNNPELDHRDMRQIVADAEAHNGQIPGGNYWADLIGAVDKINTGVADLASRPAADIAAQLDAAGIAADVRDELVKLIGGGQ